MEGRSGEYVDQLTLHSNKKAYGPFGGSGGGPFSVDFSGKALQYVFGRSGDKLDQLGFGFGKLAAELPTTIVRSSEHGGTGGSSFDDLDHAGNLLGKITSITVRHGTEVDNIKVSYDGQPGSNAHGGTGGSEDTFTLTGDEWVTEIHGRSGQLLDQVQFVLSSGRVSPVYGGFGGSPFSEIRKNNVVKAFFGRSGEYVDQLGVYWENAKPLNIEITDIHYDLDHLNTLAMPPIAAFQVQLENSSSIAQQVTQTRSLDVTDTSTTTTAETNEESISMKFATDFVVSKSEITIGYTHSETVTTGRSHAVQTSYAINFEAMVPPSSAVTGTCIVKKSTYDIPWQATAKVTYQNLPQPTTMTLNGTLKGVTTTSVDATYEQAKVTAGATK